MSPGAIVDPSQENKRQSQYAWLVLALIAIALIATALITQSSYQHPMPPSDCTVAQDYVATCSRATTPEPAKPWSPIALYLGTLAGAIIAVLLIQASWGASVTRQQALITTFANTAPATQTAPATTPAKTPPASMTTPPVKPAATAPVPPTKPAISAAAPTAPAPTPMGSPQAPAAAPLQPPTAPRARKTTHPVERDDPAAFARATPSAITANGLAADMIKPPAAAPKSGVDPKKVEGKQ